LFLGGFFENSFLFGVVMKNLFWLRRAGNADEIKHVEWHCHTDESPLEALCGYMWGVTRPLDEYFQRDLVPQKPFCWKCRLLSWLRLGLSCVGQPVHLGFYSGACFGVFAFVGLIYYLFKCMAPYYAYTTPELFFFEYVAITFELAGYLLGLLVSLAIVFEFRWLIPSCLRGCHD
jgi:hypothetical protein